MSAVEITATNVATGFRYEAATTPTGRYWLTGLPPGRYDILASRIGLESTAQEDVALPIGKTLTLDFTVAVSALELEGIRVLAPRTLVASTDADVAFAMDQEMIQRLPEESRSFIDLAALAPGATTGPGVGYTNLGTEISVGALNAQSMGVLVDGGDFTEPAFGDVTGGVPLLAIQEFEVIQTSYSAELGRTASGVVNAVTRRGTNEFEIEAFGLFRGRQMTALGHFEETKPDFSRSHWGFAVGGPIAQDRTHFFMAMERKVENNFATINTASPIPGVNGTFKTPFTDNLMFARLDHRISDTHELSLRYTGEIAEKVVGVGADDPPASPSTGLLLSSDLHGALLTHRWSLGGGMVNQARFHVIHRNFNEGRIADAGPTLCYPSICVGPVPEWGPTNYTRIELIEDLSFVATGASGTHRIKLGTQVSWQDNHARYHILEDGLFFFPSDEAVDPEFALVGSGLIGTVSQNTQVAVFAQDEWNPTPSLTLNIGLRYEIETNGTNQGYVSPLAGQLPFIRTTPRPVDKNNIGPRLGFAWDAAEDGSTVIRGGFGIFYDALPQHSLGDGLESHSGAFLFGGIPEPASLNVDELLRDNPLFFGELHWPNAAELKTPMTRQFSLGFEQEVTGGVVLRVDGLVIQGRNIPMERSLNTWDADYEVRKYPDHGDLFQMLTEGEADAKLLMMQASKTLDRGWMTLAYTLADRQNTSDAWNDFIQGPLDPEVTDFSGLKGRAAWDERHRIVATGGFDYPFGLSVSGKLVYSSGRPYTAIVVDDLNRDGINADRPPGEPRNEAVPTVVEGS